MNLFGASHIPRPKNRAKGSGRRRIDRHYTGGTICYVASMRMLTPVLTKIRETREVRKDPIGFLNVLGPAGEGLADIEARIGEILDAPVHIHVSDPPGIGMDMAKPGDLELAEEWLGPSQ